jgi:hypothetical protein
MHSAAPSSALGFGKFTLAPAADLARPGSTPDEAELICIARRDLAVVAAIGDGDGRGSCLLAVHPQHIIDDRNGDSVPPVADAHHQALDAFGQCRIQVEDAPVPLSPPRGLMS